MALRSLLTIHLENYNPCPMEPPFTLQSPTQIYELLRTKVFCAENSSFRAEALRQNQVWHFRERVQLSPALAAAQVLEAQRERPLLLVLPNDEELQAAYDDLSALGFAASVFPGWHSSLYKGIRSQNRLFVQRSAVLAHICLWHRLENAGALIVLTTLRAMAPVLPPFSSYGKNASALRIGSPLQPAELAAWLSRYGYYQVPRVSLPGEFALRGEVLDFCPPPESFELAEQQKIQASGALAAKNANQSKNQGRGSPAVRVMFGFDEVEMLKVFDCSSQISQRQLEGFPLFPLKEVLWNEEQQTQLRQRLDDLLLGAEAEDFAVSAGKGSAQNGDKGRGPNDDKGRAQNADWQELWAEQQGEIEKLLAQLALRSELPGEELLFPFASEKPVSLLEYMGADCLALFWGAQRIERQQDAWKLELDALHAHSLSADGQENRFFSELLQRKLLRPERFFADAKYLQIQAPASIVVDELEGSPWPLEIEPALQYHGNLNRFGEDLQNWLLEGYSVVIGCSSAAQAQRLAQLLKDYAENLQFFPAQLSRGLIFGKHKLALLSEWEILGGSAGLRDGSRPHRQKKRIAEKLSRSEVIDSFLDLREGDLVVHVQHGIGRFLGIERIKSSRMERDYLAIEYADANRLFIPIEQVNMVQRYIGSHGEGDASGKGRLRLDRIGGKAWGERKAKAQKAVEDLADHLLRLYARRAEAESFCCAPDDELVAEFEADFPYEETADQLRAVEEIKRDMESPRPMDRLLCGDVGFGKTEVAMRASFKMTGNGRQVIILCPTTILAEQHYQNFSQRFARFPVRIAMLSRFVEAAEQKRVLAALEAGKVDILIGTHRILSKDIHLQNLGLIVIDEEQRFGVKHKERLKMLKTSIDCLSMSATPIPRTLHMSLVQIRDISMLATAPHNRQPVETFVREFNTHSIAAAIRSELERGGQVFYLHNRIEGLEEILRFLRELVPEALVEMAHGQMESKQLEDIMYRFVHGGFNVLLATTIIENGIDIPNVNTIIIDRAERYGIGQLYQLRGRVGRSNQLAYAYLFYPERRSLSNLALKRLAIISDFTELGSGFKVAMKDLEVRGAGNLLGAEQSGRILAVGFEMYSSMLAKAINERRPDAAGDEWSETSGPISLELEYSGFIPDTYIADASEKVDLYKRISSIDRPAALTRLYEELFDRFGTPPSEVQSLLQLAELRITCRKVGIDFLKEARMQVELQFSRAKPLPLERIMQLIQRYPKIFRIQAQNDSLRIDLNAFMQLEAEQQKAREQQAAKPQKKKRNTPKNSRNASYLAQNQKPAPQQSTVQSDDVLLQKTAALHRLLSSFYEADAAGAASTAAD